MRQRNDILDDHYGNYSLQHQEWRRVWSELLWQQWESSINQRLLPKHWFARYDGSLEQLHWKGVLYVQPSRVCELRRHWPLHEWWKQDLHIVPLRVRWRIDQNQLAKGNHSGASIYFDQRFLPISMFLLHEIRASLLQSPEPTLDLC